MAKTIRDLSDLTPDPKNARRHNPRNVGMIERALGEVGSGRSIVIDEDGVVLAGNATIEAAANAGIERVHVVDVDGETIVAVRRSNLTPEQKTKLALYDNRTAELADWDPVVLAEDIDAGIDLTGLFTEAEVDRILSAIPAPADWDDAMGGLPDEDRAPFRQMTFTVHDDQFAEIERALSVAKAQGGAASDVNENTNGNALAHIAATFMTDHADR